MTDPVQAAIDAAAKAADQHQATATHAAGVSTLPANASSNEVAVAGPAFSMETVGAGQMAVDQWLKVKEDGVLVGDNKTKHEEIRVIIDMTDGQGFRVKQGIKGGNPAQYAYTYDGRVANDGKPWDAACGRIRSLPNAGGANPYPCVDLPMEVIADVIGKDGKTVEIEAGKILGYTTSTTNWTNWTLFHSEVKKADLLGQKVEVKLGYQERKNNKNNIWGVVTFKLVGLAATNEAAD